jgi:hypothetical protein
MLQQVVDSEFVSLLISIGITTGYGLEGLGSIVGGGEIFFSVLHSIQTVSGAHPGSYPMGIGGSFRKAKRPRRDVYNSPSSCAEAKNNGAIPPLPHTSSWHGALFIRQA